MLLVTSANGKTGRHMLRALAARDLPIRAMGHTPAAQSLTELGAKEVFIGDQLDQKSLDQAMDGVDTVVHIGPPMHPFEAAMGQFVIAAAQKRGVAHFVYISVLHPQIEALLNHQAKLRVEDALIRSRLPFTILQPTHYMQNIDVVGVAKEGRLSSPFALESRLSFVDMEDVAEVAAKVVTEPGHDYASYPLCSADRLTTYEVADLMSKHCRRTIEAHYVSLDRVLDEHAPEGSIGDQTMDNLRRNRKDVPDYSLDALRRLVAFYNGYGIAGNPNVLTWLLGRAPSSVEDYIIRNLNQEYAP